MLFSLGSDSQDTGKKGREREKTHLLTAASPNAAVSTQDCAGFGKQGQAAALEPVQQRGRRTAGEDHLRPSAF